MVRVVWLALSGGYPAYCSPTRRKVMEELEEEIG
jgi:hypothetical protein